jgi:hypothetical protein
MHVWLVHAAGVPHDPVPLHVSTPLPEHCVVVGVHDPVHAPMTHAELEHATGMPHAPPLHVSTPLPPHCVWPGAHMPVQAPLTHVWLVHATGVPHDPVALHVSALLLVHCVVAGVHATQVLFQHTAVVPEQVVWVCHVPVALHD